MVGERTRLFTVITMLCGLVAAICAPSTVYAQYRGGRKPPEPPLKRAGLLFLEASYFDAQPGRDFASSSGGAASAGSGWKLSVGSWLVGGLTGEIEIGRFTNERYSDINPWYLYEFANVTRQMFETHYWQLLLRLNATPDRRVIPFIVGGFGGVYPSFRLEFVLDGQNRSATHSASAALMTLGMGVNVVIAGHATIVAEWRTMDWFGDWLIPSVRYWSVRRLGIGLSWHF